VRSPEVIQRAITRKESELSKLRTELREAEKALHVVCSHCSKAVRQDSVTVYEEQGTRYECGEGYESYTKRRFWVCDCTYWTSADGVKHPKDRVQFDPESRRVPDVLEPEYERARQQSEKRMRDFRVKEAQELLKREGLL
jgi:hypothetical protein